MTRKSTKGTKLPAAELLAEVIDEFKAFCRKRDETVRYHSEMAIHRHMANPLPKQEPILLSATPLPSVTSPASSGGEASSAESSAEKRARRGAKKGGDTREVGLMAYVCKMRRICYG